MKYNIYNRKNTLKNSNNGKISTVNKMNEDSPVNEYNFAIGWMICVVFVWAVLMFVYVDVNIEMI